MARFMVKLIEILMVQLILIGSIAGNVDGITVGKIKRTIDEIESLKD